MLVYESKDNEILTEDEYNALTKREFEAGFDGRLQDITAEDLKEYRETDSDFRTYDFDYLNDFGDYDLYTEIEEGNLYNAFFVKYHQNVNQKDRIFLVNQKDTSDILEASDDFDDANDGDEKWAILQGIEDRLGLN